MSNFATDNRVNQTGQDPCASTYVSNLIQLDNPATDLKVEFAAYRRSSSDIRVFFKTIAEGSSENSMDVDFELFPALIILIKMVKLLTSLITVEDQMIK